MEHEQGTADVLEPRFLYYAISFLVPVAGIITGALYQVKPEAEQKRFGKVCLTLGAVSIGLWVVLIGCILAFYALYGVMLFALLEGTSY